VLTLNLNELPSFLETSFEVCIIIPFSLDFFFTKLLGFVERTEHFIKHPTEETFLKPPLYK